MTKQFQVRLGNCETAGQGGEDDDHYPHTQNVLSHSLKKFEWRDKGQLIQLHFDGLPHASAWHSPCPHWNTHSHPFSAVTAARSHESLHRQIITALLLNGHQTVGSQQFRTLSHKTKWNPIRSRTTKINLPPDLSDQNDFRYKFSVNCLNLFPINFL